MLRFRSPKPEARSRKPCRSAALRHDVHLDHPGPCPGDCRDHHRELPQHPSWNDAVPSRTRLLHLSASTVAGTFVHMFFVLSGYGLTLSCLRKGTPSWAAWASERFRKIVVPYWIAVIVVFAAANLSYLWAPAGWAGILFLGDPAGLSHVPPQLLRARAGRLNPSFWFMPVLFGLYALFPLLLAGAETDRHDGPDGLFTALVPNVSIAVCVHMGFTVDHQGTMPLFFVDKFALGMVLACVACHQPERLPQAHGVQIFPPGHCVLRDGGASSHNTSFWVTGRRPTTTCSRRSAFISCCSTFAGG